MTQASKAVEDTKRSLNDRLTEAIAAIKDAQINISNLSAFTDEYRNTLIRLSLLDLAQRALVSVSLDIKQDDEREE